jgi:hypothetical protein
MVSYQFLCNALLHTFLTQCCADLLAAIDTAAEPSCKVQIVGALPNYTAGFENETNPFVVVEFFEGQDREYTHGSRVQARFDGDDGSSHWYSGCIVDSCETRGFTVLFDDGSQEWCHADADLRQER